MSFRKSTSRRSFLQNTAGLGLTAAVSTLGCASGRRSIASRNKHPNLVFIFSDQQRTGELGCYGHPTIQTPNLDRLAREGTVFDNCTSCTPVCTPYRACMLSGQYPLHTGMFLNDLLMPTDITTVAHALRNEGYRTGYIGKWHLDGQNRGGFTPPGPRRQGFDDFWAVANCNHNYMKAYYYRDNNPEPVWVKGYEPDAQTDLAVEFLRSNPQDQPFCLFVSYAPPHNPYNELPKSYQIYGPDDIIVRPNCPEPNLDDLTGYQAHITALDRNVGQIMRTLDVLGEAEDTLIVYTSDHGDMLGSHRQQRKQRPWDESVRIPLIVRCPGRIPKNRRCRTLVNTPDLMPTLVSLCGGEIPQNVDGDDLSKAWQGKTNSGPDSAYISNIISFSEARGLPEWRGVRTDHYTYVCTQDGPWMLFDNQNDPYQMENQIDAPQFREVRRKLEHQLDRWLDRTGDTFQAPEDYLRQFGYEVDPQWKHIPYVNKIG